MHIHSCVVQRGAVADWWYSWPMASTLVSLCLSQRQTFWTYIVTINLFSLYLVNFMLHTMLDATGVVLRVHTSMKCDVLLSQGRVGTILRWGEHFSYMSKEIYSSLQQCKNYKNRSRFSKVMINNVLPPFFMVHSVQKTGRDSAAVTCCGRSSTAGRFKYLKWFSYHIYTFHKSWFLDFVDSNFGFLQATSNVSMQRKCVSRVSDYAAECLSSVRKWRSRCISDQKRTETELTTRRLTVCLNWIVFSRSDIHK